jgi:hypothetical protein
MANYNQYRNEEPGDYRGRRPYNPDQPDREGGYTRRASSDYPDQGYASGRGAGLSGMSMSGMGMSGLNPGFERDDYRGSQGPTGRSAYDQGRRDYEQGGYGGRYDDYGRPGRGSSMMDRSNSYDDEQRYSRGSSGRGGYSGEYDSYGRGVYNSERPGLGRQQRQDRSDYSGREQARDAGRRSAYGSADSSGRGSYDNTDDYQGNAGRRGQPDARDLDRGYNHRRSTSQDQYGRDNSAYGSAYGSYDTSLYGPSSDYDDDMDRGYGHRTNSDRAAQSGYGNRDQNRSTDRRGRY